MQKTDFIRAMVFSWTASFLHFNKILQIPSLILFNNLPISFKDLFEIFSEKNISSPILSDIRSFFVNKAIEVQNGGPEYCASKKWLNIWWPAHEFMFIKLSTENKLTAFYKEAEEAILSYLRSRSLEIPNDLLHESILLNHQMIKRPFQKTDFYFRCSYNILEVYKIALRGESTPIKRGVYEYAIDRTSNTWSSWEEWCKEVVWYGNKKGAYLYDCKVIEENCALVEARDDYK